MNLGSQRSSFILFIGDIVAFTAALFLTLVIRYLEWPAWDVITDHLGPFSILFVLWVAVFYMAGLYSKRAVFIQTALWGILLRIQLLNIIIAALFFFFVPGIEIAPKTNLILYLGVSLALIFAWRLFLFPRMTKPSWRERAAIIGEGPEVDELATQVNGNGRYRLVFPIVRTPAEVEKDFGAFVAELKKDAITTIVADTEHDSMQPIVPKLYELIFANRAHQLLNLHDVYEEVFDRVPLSLLQYNWFIKNLSNSSSGFYLVVKRLIDIFGGIAMGIIALIASPFIWIANRIEGPGPLFIVQMRIGQNGKRVLTYKFRSMTQNDAGKWLGENPNKVTKVGAFLRKTSLDEFPQFINILRGDLSLVGPRNDMEALGLRLGEAIPYYDVRYIVKPGITGWAQINQQYEQGNISPQSIEETKTRLAYDFYYIKNRSLVLDIVIALKTVKRMLFRASSW